MAGGMGVRAPWPTLAERRRPGAAKREGPSGGHCWVMEDGEPEVRHPGLLLEWRREQGQWQGLVAFLRQAEASGKYAMVQEWLDASRLRPMGG